jgi:exosortase/archaeosortase family protein
MKRGFLKDIILRYLTLAIIGIFSMQIFYFIFLPLTLYPVYFLLKSLFNLSLISNIIWIGNFPIEIIGACVAGSAYSLLLILNLSTREIKIKKRILILFLSFLSFLIINILRIFILSIMLISGNSFFDLTHKLFWYAGSTIFIVGIWFLSVKLFRIKNIPFYSDIKKLYESGKNSHNTQRSKKH